MKSIYQKKSISSHCVKYKSRYLILCLGLRIEQVNPDHFRNRSFIISGLNIIEKKTNIDSVDPGEEFVFLPSSLAEAVNGT